MVLPLRVLTHLRAQEAVELVARCPKQGRPEQPIQVAAGVVVLAEVVVLVASVAPVS